ncbi:ATP-dependent zinc protease [Lysobacter yangpyeongensis]|uniref:ATP-dependent zinc protease n=1 Tax=Lysobacter yangpyeongensis TaxID=346182 RepID=A0ABW0SM61_9GAMM
MAQQSSHGIPARIVLGWREWACLPRLGLPAVRCKIDSGARSSALHVDRYWRFIERGVPWVGFQLSNDGHGEALVQAVAPVFDERDVIDSGGHRTRRIFLRTTLQLAGVEREIEINLTDRQRMLFPMLLGRTAMSGRFTVDPGRSYLHGRHDPAAAGPTIARAADVAAMRLFKRLPATPSRHP